MDFDQIIDRGETCSLKWERYRGRDILPLWVADMDFRSPPAVVDALRQRVAHGIFGYTLAPKELYEAIIGHLAGDFGWRIEAEWVVWLPGVVTGLNASCRTVGEAGDDVLTLTPVYPPFLTAPGLSGRNTLAVPLADDGERWTLDMDRIEKAVTPRTRLLLLCNPHNPVGRVFDERELAQLAGLCERRGIIICSDEIHYGLVLDRGRRHIPTATLSPETASRTITLLAPSKTFNIPGLGCSFAVIPSPELRQRFARVIDGIVPHVNALGYTAALAAYRDSRQWHLELLDYLRANRDLVEESVGRMPGISMRHVEATYLAWIDCTKLERENPAAFFEEAGVGLSDGKSFGGRGFMRLNFGCPRSLLQESLHRMENALR